MPDSSKRFEFLKAIINSYNFDNIITENLSAFNSKNILDTYTIVMDQNYNMFAKTENPREIFKSILLIECNKSNEPEGTMCITKKLRDMKDTISKYFIQGYLGNVRKFTDLLSNIQTFYTSNNVNINKYVNEGNIDDEFKNILESFAIAMDAYLYDNFLEVYEHSSHKLYNKYIKKHKQNINEDIIKTLLVLRFCFNNKVKASYEQIERLCTPMIEFMIEKYIAETHTKVLTVKELVKRAENTGFDNDYYINVRLNPEIQGYYNEIVNPVMKKIEKAIEKEGPRRKQNGWDMYDMEYYIKYDGGKEIKVSKDNHVYTFNQETHNNKKEDGGGKRRKSRRNKKSKKRKSSKKRKQSKKSRK